MPEKKIGDAGGKSLIAAARRAKQEAAQPPIAAVDKGKTIPPDDGSELPAPAGQMIKSKAPLPQQQSKKVKAKPGMVLHNCGHEEPVGVYLNQPCLQCAPAVRRKKFEKHKAAREKKAFIWFSRPRLPDKSKFDIQPYDEPTESWTGSLTVITPRGNQTFTDSQGAIHKLLVSLDDKYREWLKTANDIGDKSAV